MDATRTPQASVTQHNTPPSSCDLTIVILWGRLGTRLPSEVRKPDGTPYLSGTEWELEDARSAKRALWIYRRKGFKLDPDDPAYTQNFEQYAALKKFLASLRATDGSLLGGLTEYEGVSEFSTTLERHLEAELRRKLEIEDQGSPPVDERFRIFLADAADDLRGWRGRLKSQLSAMPTVRLLDDLPPPYEKEDHALVAREAAAYADLCVHLLGASPGAVIPGTDVGARDTYPMGQLRASLAHARSQLILHPDGFRTESVLDVAYRELVIEAHERQDDRLRLEIVSTTAIEAQERVLQKRRAILEDRERSSEARSKPPSAGADKAAFVDVHELDKSYTKPLVDFLNARLITLSDDVDERPGPKHAVFEDAVSRAQYLIVVFGEVATQWVLGRLDEAVKVVVERGHRLKFGIYVRPGAHWPASLRAPRYSTIIDNAGGFDRAPIEVFLGLGDRP